MFERKNRLGISALSKKYWKDAWVEELMLNKSTGELLIKTSEDKTISYMYLARMNQHMDHFSDKIIDMALFGNLYSIYNNENGILPDKFDFNTNILENPVDIIKPEDMGDTSFFGRIMISLGYDCIISDGLSYDFKDIPFEYELEIFDDDKSVYNITQRTTYNESLTNIVNIEGLGIKYNRVTLNSIKLTPNIDDIIITNPNAINVVHSILVFNIFGTDSNKLGV